MTTSKQYSMIKTKISYSKEKKVGITSDKNYGINILRGCSLFFYLAVNQQITIHKPIILEKS